jgi:transposase, IS5 family
MFIDPYAREDVFARLPELAAEIDPALRKLDGLLDDDERYQHVPNRYEGLE